MGGLKHKKGRPALRALQPAASNPKHLVGAGSPRSVTMGKPITAKKLDRLLVPKENCAVVPEPKPVARSTTVSEKVGVWFVFHLRNVGGKSGH